MHVPDFVSWISFIVNFSNVPNWELGPLRWVIALLWWSDMYKFNDPSKSYVTQYCRPLHGQLLGWLVQSCQIGHRLLWFSVGRGMKEAENVFFFTHSWESGYRCVGGFRSCGLC